MPDAVEVTREKSFPHEAYRTMEEKEFDSCLNDSLGCVMEGWGEGCFYHMWGGGESVWEANCLSSDLRLKSWPDKGFEG